MYYFQTQKKNCSSNNAIIMGKNALLYDTSLHSTCMWCTQWDSQNNKHRYPIFNNGRYFRHKTHTHKKQQGTLKMALQLTNI